MDDLRELCVGVVEVLSWIISRDMHYLEHGRVKA